MKEKIQTIADLFMEAGQAHHQAFIETDGNDSEWPLWYADYLMGKLPSLLEADMTKSELVYLLVYLSKLQSTEAPGTKWPRYYARYLAQRYL
jgi:hypothetical protein